MRELTGVAGPSGALAARTESVRRSLAARAGRPVPAIPLRAAASVTHLGLAARLIAPALGAATLGCLHQLSLDPGDLWWQDQLGGPMPLSVPGPGAGRQSPGPGTGPRWAGPGGACHRLAEDVIAPLTVAVARLAPVSPRVLWGNVASAGNSAAAQIGARRPALAPAAWAAARVLASHPRLRTERTAPGPAFRRSSCCLIYQVTPGQARAICGDCVLART